MKLRPDSGKPRQQSTGPRTAAGKRRSSRNSTKHGIFSGNLILDGEIQADFDAVLLDLQTHFQPRGCMEKYLIEQLATQMWRKRRILLAETAVISRSPGFLGNRADLDFPYLRLLRICLKDGSTPVPAKVALVQTAAQKLQELILAVQADEFDFMEAIGTLQDIYGGVATDGSTMNIATQLSVLGMLSISSKRPEDLLSREECAKHFVQILESERDRFVALVNEENQKDIAYTSLSSLIPAEGDLDRILRYEAHLSREFDRTLNQLERLQSARRVSSQQ
jgi:hypothetical protein